MAMPTNCDQLSDAELLARLRVAAREEHRCLVFLLFYLAEAERRDTIVKAGYSSSFEYCVKNLGFSEEEAYRRIHAARAAKRFPAVYSYIADGLLSLTTISRLESHLTPENQAELLVRAQGKSTREIESLLAELRPSAPRPDHIRAVGVESTAPQSPTALATSSQNAGAVDAAAGAGEDLPNFQPPQAAPAESATPSPARRLRVAFDCGERLVSKLDRAREILRHKFPAGRCEDILEAALDSLLDRKDMDRYLARRDGVLNAATDSRRIPKRVRAAVWRRDGGRCAYVSASGRRCEERGGLEYDHVIPYALGGRSDEPANIRLACRQHNQLAAKRIFGPEAVGPQRRGARA